MVTIIMMITGKRKVIPATKNVPISHGPRTIPALHKKGHIRFCPRPAGTVQCPFWLTTTVGLLKNGLHLN